MVEATARMDQVASSATEVADRRAAPWATYLRRAIGAFAALDIPRASWPLIYLLLAIPAVLFVALVRAPISSPDEWAHIARSAQVMKGRIFTEKAVAGEVPMTRIDANLIRLRDLTMARQFEPLHTTLPLVSSLEWSKKRETVISDAAVYFPLQYLPQAAGLYIGRALDLTIVQTLRLGSAVSGLLCVALSFIGLRMLAVARRTVFVLLLFPMTLFLFGSFSSDGVLIASAVVTAGAVTSTWQRRKPFPGTELVLIAIFGTILAASKLVYLPAVLAAVGCVRAAPSADAARRRLALVIGVVISAVALGWHFASNAYAVELDYGRTDVDASSQLDLLLSNPGLILTLAVTTLSSYWYGYLQQLVGVLGWLDAPIGVSGFCLLLVCAACAIGRDLGDETKRADKWCAALIIPAVLLSIGAMFFAFYLIWTPLGSLGPIEGVQGRYFLPLLPLLAILLPRLPLPAPLKGALSAVVVAAPFIADYELITTIIDRYYL